ncbi:MAG: hypothetical protein KQI81_08885 [Deltaproteobacteria bacterium]|nr:hypothetical protein [Deltaproteobacteria bacterium]
MNKKRFVKYSDAELAAYEARLMEYKHCKRCEDVKLGVQGGYCPNCRDIMTRQKQEYKPLFSFNEIRDPRCLY